MVKVLVVYYSRSGNTEKMAKAICKAIEEEGLEVECKKVEDASPDDMANADGIIVGSPTYYGTMAAELKKLFDESVVYHGKLDGKLGGAFASAAVSGHETTVLSILEAMLIHGMVIQGDPNGDHYGPVAVGEIDDKVEVRCKRFAGRFSQRLIHQCQSA